jgi:hypothetical protein
MEETSSPINRDAQMRYVARAARVYADELARREEERQGERMEALTRSMNRLTWVGVTVAVVGVFGCSLAGCLIRLHLSIPPPYEEKYGASHGSERVRDVG